MQVQIEASWQLALQAEFKQPYFAEIVAFLKAEKSAGKVIYPPGPQIFNAFAHTPLPTVKVVILGQDPYHGPNQAHGLCFSVPDGVRPPPSLVNIFKEVADDTGTPIPSSGNLERWAKQGVLLLNASLTVEAAMANAHAAIGWHTFTDAVIRCISKSQPHVVFLLWGRFAQNKEVLIDTSKHLVLKAAHPSPLSAYAGFLGCKHFSKANSWLSEAGLEPIHW
jgi:uracil-DNA glycosylase